VRAKIKKNEEYNDILAYFYLVFCSFIRNFSFGEVTHTRKYKKKRFFLVFCSFIRNFVGRITINDKIHHDEKNDFVGRSGVRHDYREGSEQ
jgi:hypothetical protein